MSLTPTFATDRIYATGCIPSTPEDWERAGVPKFSSANLSKEKLKQIITAANKKLKQEKASKSISPTDSSGSTSALSALKGKSGMGYNSIDAE